MSDKCKHEPDVNDIQHTELPVVEKPDKTEFSFVMDVNCKKCGRSGAFQVVVKYDDIDWD